jgi:hypothetical protein
MTIAHHTAADGIDEFVPFSKGDLIVWNDLFPAEKVAAAP